MALLWIIAGPAVLFAVLSCRSERRRAAYYRQRLPDTTQQRYLPPVTLIVPVKGPDYGLKENLSALATLDYPDYELIVAAREAADIPSDVVPERARVVLAGDGDPHTGEKICNLMAALETASPRSEVFAFADSDGHVAPGWLRALVAPLVDSGTGASTGYRCYLPEPPTFWAAMRSVWNSGILGSLGPGASRLAWGGAMALRREVFFRAGVPGLWKGSVSDDFGVAAAVRSARLEVRLAPGALAVSREPATARECLSWIRRQLVLTRVYAPRLWYPSFAAALAYCAAMAGCALLACGGTREALPVLVFLLLIWLWKGHRRGRLARMALPEHQPWFDRHGWIFTWGAPLASWIWLAGHIASLSSNTIEWRGNFYRLSRRGLTSFQ